MQYQKESSFHFLLESYKINNNKKKSKMYKFHFQ